MTAKFSSDSNDSPCIKDNRFRVGLDFRGAEPGFKAHFGRGTGRYVTELARALAPLSESSKILDLNLLNNKSLSPSKRESRLISLLPFGKTTIEGQFLFPRRLAHSQVQLMHFISQADAPVRSPIPYIVSVLDLIPSRFPELYKANNPNWRFHLARYLENTGIKNASGIIAISEATKRDIIELMKIPGEKIRVTPLAVSKDFTSQSDQPLTPEDKKMIRESLNLPIRRNILLYVGGIDPRKNPKFLLKIIHALYQSNISDNPLLVLVGNLKGDKHYPEILSSIDSLNLKVQTLNEQKNTQVENDTQVLISGFVGDNELRNYYKASDLFLFPSLYEGFGLPVLEAMSCGLPVIAHNNSSIPEVAGNACLLLEDNALHSWIDETKHLLMSSEKLNEMSTNGIARSKLFSWEKTAKATFEFYLDFANARR